MKRAMVVGWLLGVLTFGAGVVVGSQWYEYRWESNVLRARDLVNDEGWQVVPDQSNDRYLRRSRFHLP